MKHRVVLKQRVLANTGFDETPSPGLATINRIGKHRVLGTWYFVQAPGIGQLPKIFKDSAQAVHRVLAKHLVFDKHRLLVEHWVLATPGNSQASGFGQASDVGQARCTGLALDNTQIIGYWALPKLRVLAMHQHCKHWVLVKHQILSKRQVPVKHRVYIGHELANQTY